MKFDEAKQIAEEVKGWLEPYCKRIEVVGSVRRQKPEVGDVELLCIPTPYTEFKGNWFTLSLSPAKDMLDSRLQELIELRKSPVLNYRLNSKGSKVYGPKNKLLTHVASGFPVDIFVTDERVWATSLLIRTGPKTLNIKLCLRAKKRGFQLKPYKGIIDKQGNIVKLKTEEEIFKLLGIDYVPPERRDEYAKTLPF